MIFSKNISKTLWPEAIVYTLYCAITALDGYPSHLDKHPLYSVGNPYICATALYGPCYHFHPRHSLHLPFASGQHLLMPEPSHPSHVIGSFVTGTPITSVHQEARPDSVVPPLLRQAMECGGN